MKLGLFAVTVLLGILPVRAVAGPNAYGTLVVHQVGLDSSCEILGSAPAACDLVDNEIPAGVPGCGWYFWKVYASFPANAAPRLKALSWAASFPPDVIVVAGGVPNPSSDLEVADAGWPFTSGAGIGESFGVVQTGSMVDCYWFAGYGYGVGDVWSVVPHAVQGAYFVDDQSPPNLDPIIGLSSIGFGTPGTTICPNSPADVAGGDHPGTPQVRNLESWGRLKHLVR